MNKSGHLTFRFGVFELSPASGQLRKHGNVVRLSPQPFQVLVLLVENCGAVVTREEIHFQLWGKNNTSVEFDLGLNRCVRQIRAILNDDADAPRYIETLPRRGYRFVAPVERIASATEGESGNLASKSAIALETADRLPRTASFRFPVKPALLWTASLLALISFLGFAFLYSTRSRVSANLDAVPLGTSPGQYFSPTFSPDGRQIAFTWNGERQDNFDVYLQLIGSSAPLYASPRTRMSTTAPHGLPTAGGSPFAAAAIPAGAQSG